MTVAEHIREITKLTVDERREILAYLDSINDVECEDEMMALANNPRFLAEMERRVAEADRDPSLWLTEEQFRANVRNRIS
jgi:putative addiction module component (TIGR02574 family)